MSRDIIRSLQNRFLFFAIQKAAGISDWKKPFEFELARFDETDVINMSEEEIDEAVFYAVQPLMDAINFFHAGVIELKLAPEGIEEARPVERGAAYYKLIPVDTKLGKAYIVKIGSRGYQAY